jgi:exonuclease III
MMAAQHIHSVMNMSFISQNIRANLTTFGRLINILKTAKPEIVFLQEIGVNTETLEGQVTNYGYRAICSQSEGNTIGVAVV